MRASMTKELVKHLAAIALACTFSIDTRAAPTQVVTVLLRDTSTDPSVPGMVLKIDPVTVKAGQVTFEAINQSKTLKHEVLVVPALSQGTEMPCDKRKDTVIEKRVHVLGEISDLKPSTRGKLTLNLKSGTYLLLCNEPGHFRSGMSSRLVVEN